tara:strand:+ start:64858 stop:65622 length:765 start_codon:yes stop_codon:yes gene_type:complete
MQQIAQNFGKFLFPVFLLITGLFTLIFGAVKDQPSLFIISGFAVLVMGVVALLYALKKITFKIQIIVTIVSAIIAIVLGYNDYRTVKNDIDFVEQKKVVYSEVIQRLKDIREAQVAHKKYNGDFAPTFDSLITYIGEGKLPLVKAFGEVPDSLDEATALELGIITRDTIMVPVIDNVFLNANAQKDRKFRFNLDSLRYAPYTGAEFIMRTSNIDKGGVKTPVILIEDAKPFDPTEPLKVGSLTDASTSGNWSGE